MELNYSNWEVDPKKGIALHESGAVIRFIGHPDSDSFEGNLHMFPHDLTALEKARLVRHGFEAYRNAFNRQEGVPKSALDKRRRSDAEIF